MSIKQSLFIIICIYVTLLFAIQPVIKAEEEKTIEKENIITIVLDDSDGDKTITINSSEEDGKTLLFDINGKIINLNDILEKVKHSVEGNEQLKELDIDLDEILKSVTESLESLEGLNHKIITVTTDDEDIIHLNMDDDTIIDVNKIMKDVEEAIKATDQLDEKTKEEIIEKLNQRKSKTEDSENSEKNVRVMVAPDGEKKKVMIVKDNGTVDDCCDPINGMYTRVNYEKKSNFTNRDRSKVNKAVKKLQTSIPSKVAMTDELTEKSLDVVLSTKSGVHLTDIEQKDLDSALETFVQKLKKIVPENAAKLKIEKRIFQQNETDSDEIV